MVHKKSRNTFVTCVRTTINYEIDTIHKHNYVHTQKWNFVGEFVHDKNWPHTLLRGYFLGCICDDSISSSHSLVDLLSTKLINYKSVVIFIRYFDLSARFFISELY